jgi:hypothetical protein
MKQSASCESGRIASSLARIRNDCSLARPQPSRPAKSRTLNKTSIKPAVYGERFVKRHGLFFVSGASGHGDGVGLRKPAGQ